MYLLFLDVLFPFAMEFPPGSFYKIVVFFLIVCKRKVFTDIAFLMPFAIFLP